MPIVVNGQVYKSEHIITQATPRPILGAAEPEVVSAPVEIIHDKPEHAIDLNHLKTRSSYMNDMLTSK